MSTSTQSPHHSSSNQRSERVRTVRHSATLRSIRLSFATVLVTGVAFLTLATVGTESAMAATATVNLGTASSYAVLAGSTITNTGSSTISGDIGLSPGTSITGFPPGIQTSGTTQIADGAALAAQNDLTTAFNSASGRTATVAITNDLGGSTLVSGVYQATSIMGLTGTVTLDGGGDANSVFIFQAGSTLTTASSASVVLENGAQACNVFWEVGSSATLGSSTNFVGTILAATSITLNTGAVVNGRLQAMSGAVTLDDNTIDLSTCLTPPTTTTTAVGTTTTSAPSTTTTTATSTTSTIPTTSTTLATGTTSTTLTPPTTSPPNSSPPTTFVPTTTPKFVLPRGAPQTGGCGSAHSERSLWLPLGLIALGLVGLTGTMVARVRRIP